MKVITFFLALSSLIFLSGCTSQHLSVRTEYLGCENLASHHINTPDPSLDCPPNGQRLIISWFIPKSYQTYTDLHLHLTVRFKNREQDERTIVMNSRWGFYLYDLINERYCQTGGIATYKVEMIGDGVLLEKWEHPLWVELINLNL